jgi:hypothetical protein
MIEIVEYKASVFLLVQYDPAAYIGQILDKELRWHALFETQNLRAGRRAAR